jgi:hypothetical protein
VTDLEPPFRYVYRGPKEEVGRESTCGGWYRRWEADSYRDIRLRQQASAPKMISDEDFNELDRLGFGS